MTLTLPWLLAVAAVAGAGSLAALVLVLSLLRRPEAPAGIVVLDAPVLAPVPLDDACLAACPFALPGAEPGEVACTRGAGHTGAHAAGPVRWLVR